MLILSSASDTSPRCITLTGIKGSGETCLTAIAAVMVSSNQRIATNEKGGPLMAVAVEKVITKKQVREFIKFPYTLYENDSNWFPPLLMDDYRKINRKEHLYYQHAEAEFFLSCKGGNAAGRIAAIHDSVWGQTHNDKAAYWGLFECENDPGLGALKKCRNRGIGLPWVEKDNVAMTNTATKIGATPYRKYQVDEHIL